MKLKIKLTQKTLHQQISGLYLKLKKQMEVDKELLLTVDKITRNLQQNARIHAMLGDLSKQCYVDVLNALTGKFEKQKVDIEVWKRATLQAWFRNINESPAMLIRALDDSGIDLVHHKSSKLTVEQAASYIDFIEYSGAKLEVKWSCPAHLQDGDR